MAQFNICIDRPCRLLLNTLWLLSDVKIVHLLPLFTILRLLLLRGLLPLVIAGLRCRSLMESLLGSTAHDLVWVFKQHGQGVRAHGWLTDKEMLTFLGLFPHCSDLGCRILGSVSIALADCSFSWLLNGLAGAGHGACRHFELCGAERCFVTTIALHDAMAGAVEAYHIGSLTGHNVPLALARMELFIFSVALFTEVVVWAHRALEAFSHYRMHVAAITDDCGVHFDRTASGFQLFNGSSEHCTQAFQELCLNIPRSCVEGYQSHLCIDWQVVEVHGAVFHRQKRVNQREEEVWVWHLVDKSKTFFGKLGQHFSDICSSCALFQDSHQDVRQVVCLSVCGRFCSLLELDSNSAHQAICGWDVQRFAFVNFHPQVQPPRLTFLLDPLKASGLNFCPAKIWEAAISVCFTEDVTN
mmetsp:Transcript_70952/g.125448  ORF Transcript_70952/g.125448 Transcript_70952/m.125448 type:complete len:413 (+) Transcript_70952:638-1876(+)